jgi:hypothetical protein
MSDQHEVLNLKAVVASLAAILFGLAILYASAVLGEHHPRLEVVVREAGALIFVTGLLSIFWELLAKRSLADEIITKVGISRQILASGLRKITPNFHRDIDWPALFKDAHQIDIFFAYGGSWRAAHYEELNTFARRNGARLRIILPDADDADIVGEMARRFSTSAAETVKRIRSSTEEFEALAKNAVAKIEVWYLPRSPVFSYYRFDSVAIMGLYHHKNIRATVPALTFAKPGSLYDYFSDEFESMMVGDAPPARKGVHKLNELVAACRATRAFSGRRRCPADARRRVPRSRDREL